MCAFSVPFVLTCRSGNRQASFHPLSQQQATLALLHDPRPSLARRTTIFWWDFLSLQCASIASDNPCAAKHGNALQLLFKLGMMLMKHFVNPLPQIHESVNGHP